MRVLWLLPWLPWLCCGGGCDESSLLRLPGPWRTQRDLAHVQESAPVNLTKSLRLRFQSVVPSFGKEAYIALLHPKDRWILKWFRYNQLFCTGAQGSHRSRVKVVHAPLSVNFLCPWPKEEASLGHYEVFFEDAWGKVLGKVQGNYKPSLLKSYGTVACMRNVWNDPGANVSGLRVLPQWLEFHRLRGVEHFIVYTTSDMSPVMREVYQPYIDAGLVSRVHFNMTSQKCWWDWHKNSQVTLMMNDCLYRSRGHAKWLFPSLDVDEYLGGFKENVTSFLDHEAAQVKDGVVDSIYLRKMRFARAANESLEISSTRRCKGYEDGAKKYAARVDLVRGVGLHWKTDGDGTVFRQLEPSVAKVHHYRHPTKKEMRSKNLAQTEDKELLAELPKLETALEMRYGKTWRALLRRWGEAPEKAWRCYGRSNNAHGKATWKNGTNFNQKTSF